MSFPPTLSSLFALLLTAPAIALAGEVPGAEQQAEINRSHFLWIVPDASGTQAELVYSDSLKKSSHPFAFQQQNEIAEAVRIYARDYENETVPLKLTGADGRYTLPMPGKELQAITGKNFSVVTGYCQWRVFAGGKNGPYLLSYAASLAPGICSVKPWDRLALEIRPELADIGTIIEVSWKGKPLADAEVEILVPDQEKPVKTSSGKQGSLVFEHAFRDLPRPGLYGIRVRHVEAREGKLHDRAFKEIHHFATLTLPVPKR